ncbi:ImmA/IrrE family metallo-endopeptidase [Clavibacter nebraskensis]|uniref:ImmA/IrrE family metallo-endopeptidase n=1 Tax=Clavibacter nebraskensis TaxID=31963 RepID=UPI003F866A77
MREVAIEERTELGLGARDPLDPYDLCAEHGIPVYPLTDFVDSPEAVAHFSQHRVKAWSAALLPIGSGRVIIENDRHPPVRRRSSIAHELGHHLLEHHFDGVVLGDDHGRQFDEKQEKEATFLSGELLIPQAAAARMAYDKWNNAQVAEKYGVSVQFAQMQMKGPRVRAARAEVKFRQRRIVG